jgi:hypothetical protein
MHFNCGLRTSEHPERADKSAVGGRDNVHEQIDPGIRMGDSTVMLSTAKHLAAYRVRPFASLRVTV